MRKINELTDRITCYNTITAIAVITGCEIVGAGLISELANERITRFVIANPPQADEAISIFSAPLA